MSILSEEFLNEVKFNNKSGKMFTEKYILNHFPNDYTIIIEYINNNNLNDLSFKEMVYHVINDISNYVICKNSNCLNRVKYYNSTIGYKDYCSKKCAGSDPDIQRKKEKTNIKKFGVKYASLNKDIKEKIKLIYDNRTDEYKKSILSKRINTVNKKYGYINVNQVPMFSNKRIESFKENIESFKENYKKSSLERYGVDHPWRVKEIHNKGISKIIKHKKEISFNIIKNRIPNGYELLEVKKSKDLKLISVIKCGRCGNNFEITHSNLYERVVRNNVTLCTICNPINSNISDKEIQLLNFIKNNYNDRIISNTRDIISPLELDIYLPDKKLAFEFNGVYWHSELYKDKNYHYNKTNICSQNGIQLIHIWEDDWVYKNDIVKSMILNKLNKTPNKIYARKTEIRQIKNNKIVRDFLNENHLQGFVGSKIKLGLFYNDKLVSIMTFGNLRKPLGSTSSDNDYELIRFCNILNTNVIGGASKLFKYFIKMYNPYNIISYSDNSYSNGNLYKTLGFIEEIKKVKLNYYWVLDLRREHRYNYRKSRLVKMGYDKNKSEREIMYEDIGAFRIWGSGNKKWIFNKVS